MVERANSVSDSVYSMRLAGLPRRGEYGLGADVKKVQFSDRCNQCVYCGPGCIYARKSVPVKPSELRAGEFWRLGFTPALVGDMGP